MPASDGGSAAEEAAADNRTPSAGAYERLTQRICDLPERVRPREAMKRHGAEHVSDDVLLAIILRSGVRGTNVVDLARELMSRYGSLTAIGRAPAEELERVPGMGEVKAQVLLAALEIGRRLGEERLPRRVSVRSAVDVAQLLRHDAQMLDREKFWVLHLDGKNNLKQPPVMVTSGLLDASLVHPREVFRDAIRSATAAVILAHNHPSGDPTPSAEDIRITRQLVLSGKTIDIRVLDHVIIGRELGDGKPGYMSLRESGIVEFS